MTIWKFPKLENLLGLIGPSMHIPDVSLEVVSSCKGLVAIACVLATCMRAVPDRRETLFGWMLVVAVARQVFLVSEAVETTCTRTGKRTGVLLAMLAARYR